MKRRLLIGLFALGTIGGFGSAGASFTRHHHHRREAFEDHVARVCVDAARAVDRQRGNAEAARPTPPPERRRHPHRRHCDR